MSRYDGCAGCHGDELVCVLSLATPCMISAEVDAELKLAAALGEPMAAPVRRRDGLDEFRCLSCTRWVAWSEGGDDCADEDGDSRTCKHEPRCRDLCAACWTARWRVLNRFRLSEKRAGESASTTPPVPGRSESEAAK